MINIRKLFGSFHIKTFFRLYGSWIYQENESSFDFYQIEQKMMEEQGGSVDLCLNDETQIASLNINNPSKKNAFSGKMMCDLKKAVETLSSWKNGKALILYGADHWFCSGADFDTIRNLSDPNDGEKMCMYMQNTLTELQRLPLLTLAYIEGKAIGGGAELITACDFRLMTEDAEIQFIHKNLGLTPGWGGVTRLMQILGRRKTFLLLASAQKLESHHAYQIGLVDHVVALTQKDIFHEIQIRVGDKQETDTHHDQFVPDCSVHNAVDWLHQVFHIDDTDVNVLRAIKTSVVNCCESATIDSSLRHEKDVFRSVWGAEANAKVISGFKHEK